MKKPHRLEKGPLDLIEEAVHLLRLAPASLFAFYYLGSLPFILGLLFFWADMSRGSFAERRLAGASLGLAALFLWMKLWQALFARRMLARVCGEAPPPLRWGGLWRTALTQAIVQPSGLLVLPVALALLVPFGWTWAFYQNVTVLEADEAGGLRSLLRRAFRQAALWPAQNHYGLLTLKLFGFFVCLNLASGFLLGPFLLKTLLGVETAFSRSWGAALNSTFFAAMAGLAYLCMDPLAKTFYVLRCFYGESLRTGQDLRTELRSLAGSDRGPALAALLLCLFSLAAAAAPLEKAAPAPAPEAISKVQEENPKPKTRGARARSPRPAGPNSIAPPALDEAIREVINRREYNWRLPREKADKEQEKGPFASFMEDIAVTLRDWLRRAGDWMEKLQRWLTGGRGGRHSSSRGGLAWMSGLHWLLAGLIVVLACAVAVILLRLWQRRQPRLEEIAAQPAQAVPDLADEGVGADQLPEDGWSRLARELIEQGQLRLALRAFYLASLAHLAGRDFIRLARFKSNRDYERELGRRSHALPEVVQTFSENVAVFDGVWYGLHAVSREMLDQFAGKVEKIKSLG
jgi:hypothetical protein